VESTGRSEIQRRVAPFAAAIADEQRDLDELALAVSMVLQPDLDLIGTLAVLDQLAADCPTPTRDGVIAHLFGSGLFRGDPADYQHWRNSCLDRVIELRRGMPITLAVVAIEVARRVGVPLHGVGMPGHFLVGDPADPGWFADPFHGGTSLDPDDCRELAAALGVPGWSPRFLDPTPNRLVVARILNNLKVSCERRGDLVRLALVMQARQAMTEFASERDDARRSLAALN
jgi:regulator of sirC expression with transglutaminase-like and TPR domain